MKLRLLIVILWIPAFAGMTFGQTYEELQDIFFYTSKKLDQARDSIEILKDIAGKQDSIIRNDRKIYEKDSLTIMNLNTSIELLKGDANKVVMPPVIEFAGFYPGLSVYYPFADSVLTRQTVLDGMKYDITAAFKFRVVQRLDITGMIGVPLRKEKFYIKLNTEWRVF